VRAVTISILLLLVAAVGVSLGGPLCRTLVKHVGLGDELGITGDQREQLEELYENTEKEIIEARGKMRIKRLEMERLMRSDDPDMREIRRLVNEIGDARSSSMLAGIERNIRMKRILAPEQMDRAGKMMMRMGRGRDHRAAAPRGEWGFHRSGMRTHAPGEPGTHGMGCKGHMMQGSGGSSHEGMGCKGHMMQGSGGSGHKGMGCKGHMMQGSGGSGHEGMGRKGHMMQGSGGSGHKGMGCKGHMMQGSGGSDREPETPEGK
jgi:Spy/CpxP family protein refolding chaperone